MIPETRYARTADGVHIAYQVRGDGPVDLVHVAGHAANFEVELEEPRTARFHDRLSEFSRLILFDKRGSGLSDRRQTPDLDMRADDLRAVLDSVGSDSAVLLGGGEGGSLAAFFATTHPERVSGLILWVAAARIAWAPDYPIGVTREQHLADREEMARGWGTIELARKWIEEQAPSLADDPEYVTWFAKAMRHAASPAAAVEFEDVWYGTDVRSVLGTVQAPTLVLHRGVEVDAESSRDLADRIPGARYVEFPGGDSMLSVGAQDDVLEVIEGFLSSLRAEQAAIDRVLATVLFTDIVGSTEKLAEIGDAGWKQLLERHHDTIRALVGRYRGREVDSAGDGFLATFDGPARAIRCATSILEAIRDFGISIRAGIHAGECELVGEKVAGMAVHIGSRVTSLAQPGEVLISSTVKDLVAGSGLMFEDRGEHELKGVPGVWHLYAVAQA